MDTYFIIPILCYVIPLGAWLVYSADTLKIRLIYLASAFVLGCGGYFLITSVEKTLSSWTRDAPAAVLGPYVEGDIQTIQVDGHDIKDFKKGFDARRGQSIYLYGWMKSKIKHEAPPSISLCTSSNEIPFSVSKVIRPDVVEHEKDPDLLESGFTATVQIPKDLPLGDYGLKVIITDGYRMQTYIPYIQIKIILLNQKDEQLDQIKNKKNISNTLTPSPKKWKK